MVVKFESLDSVPREWLQKMGSIDATGWLTEFAQRPAEALARLISDSWYGGALNAIDPEQLLFNWFEIIGNSANFADRVDFFLSQWIDNYWGQLRVPQQADEKAKFILARDWLRVRLVIDSAKGLALLRVSRKNLYERMARDEGYFESLRTPQSRVVVQHLTGLFDTIRRYGEKLPEPEDGH